MSYGHKQTNRTVQLFGLTDLGGRFNPEYVSELFWRTAEVKWLDVLTMDEGSW